MPPTLPFNSRILMAVPIRTKNQRIVTVETNVEEKDLVKTVQFLVDGLDTVVKNCRSHIRGFTYPHLPGYFLLFYDRKYKDDEGRTRWKRLYKIMAYRDRRVMLYNNETKKRVILDKEPKAS